jgi:hypothetical protein
MTAVSPSGLLIQCPCRVRQTSVLPWGSLIRGARERSSGTISKVGDGHGTPLIDQGALRQADSPLWSSESHQSRAVAQRVEPRA